MADNATQFSIWRRYCCLFRHALSQFLCATENSSRYLNHYGAETQISIKYNVEVQYD